MKKNTAIPAAFHEWVQTQINRIKEGPLGSLGITQKNPYTIITAVEEMSRSASGKAGGQGRATYYADIKVKVLADWDALSAETRAKRGSRTSFAHEKADLYKVTPKIIQDWIANRP